VEIQVHTFLTSALDGGKWSASHPCRFTPGEKSPEDRRLGGPQSQCGGGGEEKKIPSLLLQGM